MNNQQANAYGQHQWHQQSATGSHSIMTNQTYPANNYPLSGTTNQLIMMQPVHHHTAIQQTSSEIASGPHQLASITGNNYVGPTALSPHAATVNSNENGSTSDESDDNAANDPNVSKKIFKSSLHNFLISFCVLQL